MDHGRAAGTPPGTDPSFDDKSDARLVTLLYGVAKMIDEGKVARFAAGPLREAGEHLQDSLDAALRTAETDQALLGEVGTET